MVEPSADVMAAGGWIVVAALLVGFVVRLLKADKLNAWLEDMGAPAIPKWALPFVALGLGAVSGALEAVASGRSWRDAALSAFYGLLSGALAIAGNETVGAVVTKASPAAGRVVFAKGKQ